MGGWVSEWAGGWVSGWVGEWARESRSFFRMKSPFNA